jgi:RimJ/RimL family protein N-acetyltransferase
LDCQRIWLITTNDNLHALKFCQKVGFHLVKIYRGAIRESRKLKPQIPEIGMHGIPIRDEIELEITL